MKLFICLLCFILLFSSASVVGQAIPEKKKGWHLMDLQSDGYFGISLDKAYELLKGRKSKTVIVGVIDSGIDTLHEDLNPILWRNPKELQGNGVDDDKNGYVDDLFGWNFCGSTTGENLTRNTHEIARVYHNWKKDFKGKNLTDVPADKHFLYGQWKKAETIIEKEYVEAKTSIGNVTQFLEGLEVSARQISEALSVSPFTVNALDNPVLKTGSALIRAVAYWKDMFKESTDSTVTNVAIIEDVKKYRNDLQSKITRYDELPEDMRGSLVKDNYADINDRFYGNNNLKEGSGNHGTSVAGIIGAVRGNEKGMDGIADNVRIMAIRAVPGGDEHDKDVALAIRYAVDNGASIINMSFGKPVSPYKQFVDDAVRYASSKGVLLVHGSGNEAEDIGVNVFYPNAEFLDGKRATNLLTVGASGDKSTGSLSAPFSNYNKEKVDVFAPGVFIYTSTTNNGYEAADGTSFASPVTAAIAALLKSYFPELTPEQLIEIINQSGTPVTEEVLLPGDASKKVSFSYLCKTGKIVNAYQAVKLALAREKK